MDYYGGYKMPFYMVYPMQNVYLTEMDYEKDKDRMKELYPKEARKIQQIVEEECDKMEYDGSLMFDHHIVVDREWIWCRFYCLMRCLEGVADTIVVADGGKKQNMGADAGTM